MLIIEVERKERNLLRLDDSFLLYYAWQATVSNSNFWIHTFQKGLLYKIFNKNFTLWSIFKDLHLQDKDVKVQGILTFIKKSDDQSTKYKIICISIILEQNLVYFLFISLLYSQKVLELGGMFFEARLFHCIKYSYTKILFHSIIYISSTFRQWVTLLCERPWNKQTIKNHDKTNNKIVEFSFHKKEPKFLAFLTPCFAG